MIKITSRNDAMTKCDMMNKPESFWNKASKPIRLLSQRESDDEYCDQDKKKYDHANFL